MAYTYTRTVNVQPSGSTYEWTNPASSWITITQQGTSDSWNIEIADNTSNTSRSATLTVTHEDGVTSDTINVSQAAAPVINNPTPVVTATPTATPTPTVSLSSFTIDNYTTSSNPLSVNNTTSTSPATVSYTIVLSGQSPATPTVTSAPNLISPNGYSVSNPTSSGSELETGSQTWTGTISVWQMESSVVSSTQEVQVTWGGITDSFYISYTIQPDDGGGIRLDDN